MNRAELPQFKLFTTKLLGSELTVQTKKINYR